MAASSRSRGRPARRIQSIKHGRADDMKIAWIKAKSQTVGDLRGVLVRFAQSCAAFVDARGAERPRWQNSRIHRCALMPNSRRRKPWRRDRRDRSIYVVRR